MAIATKIVRCLASFSHPSLSPATMVQTGLTTQCHRRSGKEWEAAIKVDVQNRQIDASTFKGRTGVKPTEATVGNGLIVDMIMPPCTGVSKRRTIMGEGSGTIDLDMQATTLTDPCEHDPRRPIGTGLYGNPRSRMHPSGWETKKVIDISRGNLAKLNGANPKGILFTWGATGSNDMSTKYVARLCKSEKHIIASQTEHKCLLDLSRHFQDEGCGITFLSVGNNCLINVEHLENEICTDKALVSIMTVNNEIEVIQQMEEIGKLYQKPGAFFHINGEKVIGSASVDVSKWNVDWRSTSGLQVYRLKRIGANDIRYSLKVKILLLIADWGQEHVLRTRTLTPSLVIGFGEAHRIAQEDMEYTHTSEPFFQHSSCSSTMRGDNYMRKGYHNNKPKQFTRALRTMSHIKAGTRKGKRKANEGRDPKWAISYSEITTQEAEKRLGRTLDLHGIPIERMLEGKDVLLGPDMVLELKREIYRDLVNCIRAAGYPMEANGDFKEGNIHDMVAYTINSIVSQFTRDTERKLRVLREKEITSQDSHTSGMQEFVAVDRISYNEKKYVLVVEAKKVTLGEAIKQCFLALKDMRDWNGGGAVYGFVALGGNWRMISFDGEFKMSEGIELLFDSMDEQEERWMADYSILVECLNVALSNGGKGPVEVV